MPCAQARESLQTFFFLFSKAESKVFAVIAATKIVIRFFLFGDQCLDAGEIFIA